MHWNYRIVEMVDERWPDETWVEVREVFYNDKDEPVGHTTASVCGDNRYELKECLMMIGLGVEKDVLKAKDFKGEFPNLDEEKA